MFETSARPPRNAPPGTDPGKRSGVRRRWAIHYRQIVAMRDSQAGRTGPGPSRASGMRPPS
jgi:hypothetical protein